MPIEEETSIAKISGFVGKPEYAREKRGEQFFFVNNRFIKSGYLNHAIASAYEDLIPEKMHPPYFIFFEVDPSFIDINIPTKTEIKFEDEKSIYAILRSATRQSLGKYNIAPTLDFDQEMSIQFAPPPKDVKIFQPELPVKQSSGSVSTKGAHSAAMVNTRTEGWTTQPDDDWQKLYEGNSGDSSRDHHLAKQHGSWR